MPCLQLPSDRRRLEISCFFRLISGYAEIERTYKGGRYDFLKKAESGTMARAKIFMDRYFEDGAIYNGHLEMKNTFIFSM